jgi:hypothetical protein
MSKLNDGEVEIVLNEQTRVLRPTLAAMTALSRLHLGISGLAQALVNQEFDAVVAVIRHGLNLSDRDARTLPAEVFKNGLTADLVISLINYVTILANGGRPRDDNKPAAEEPEAAPGNV